MRVADGWFRAQVGKIQGHGAVVRAGTFLIFFALAVIPTWPATAISDNRGLFPATTLVPGDIAAPSVPDLDAASDTGFLAEVARTATLRPNADMFVSNAAFSAGTTGWNLVDEVNLDVNDWVKPNANGYIYFAFPDGALPANARITQVVIKANISNGAPAGSALVGIRRPSNGETDIIGSIAQNAPASQTFTRLSRPWDEAPWTVADVDGLTVSLHGASSYPNLKLRQLWVEVGYWTTTPAGYDTDNNTTDSSASLASRSAIASSRARPSGPRRTCARNESKTL